MLSLYASTPFFDTKFTVFQVKMCYLNVMLFILKNGVKVNIIVI